MLKRIIVFAVAAAWALSAHAQEGDPERGEEIAYTCSGCHGIPHQNNVYPTYTVPKLGGQSYGYIINSLKAYRSGQRQHPTMQAQAHTLSDRDIKDVAAYFVNLTEEEGR